MEKSPNSKFLRPLRFPYPATAAWTSESVVTGFSWLLVKNNIYIDAYTPENWRIRPLFKGTISRGNTPEPTTSFFPGDIRWFSGGYLFGRWASCEGSGEEKKRHSGFSLESFCTKESLEEQLTIGLIKHVQRKGVRIFSLSWCSRPRCTFLFENQKPICQLSAPYLFWMMDYPKGHWTPRSGYFWTPSGSKAIRPDYRLPVGCNPFEKGLMKTWRDHPTESWNESRYLQV